MLAKILVERVVAEICRGVIKWVIRECQRREKANAQLHQMKKGGDRGDGDANEDREVDEETDEEEEKEEKCGNDAGDDDDAEGNDDDSTSVSTSSQGQKAQRNGCMKKRKGVKSINNSSTETPLFSSKVAEQRCYVLSHSTFEALQVCLPN